jgi:integrase
MPVYQRGAGFQAVLNNASLPGGRLRLTFNTKIEAEQWLLSSRHALLTGGTPASIIATANGLPSTMGALLKRTEADHWTGMRAERSLVGNAQRVVDMIGEGVAPADVTDNMVRELVAGLKAKGNSTSTINRKLAAVSKMLQHYLDIGGILKMPKMPKLAEGVHRVRYINEEEEKRILRWASEMGLTDFSDFVMLGMDTGLRTRAEHLALHPSNILHSGGKPVAITVHPEQSKSKKPRVIPLTARSQEIITRRSDALFRDFSYPVLRGTWDRMKLALGLEGDDQFIPYILRHTFCSRLVQRGVHLVTVKELAGHSHVTVTMRYAHMSPHNYTDAIKVLE